MRFQIRFLVRKEDNRYCDHVENGGVVNRFLRFTKQFSVFMMCAVFFSVATHQPVRAAMVTTADMQNASNNEWNRENLKILLAKPEVQKKLLEWGMTQEEVQETLDSLTDAEIADLANKINDLPAGGNGVGAVVGAVLIVFLVLLITDLLGYTNVFPFVKKTVQ
jgi:hypothetical protein